MAVILNFPQKVTPPEVIRALVSAGMKEPAEVMVIGKGDIAFDIEGHDFYLKLDPKGGYRFHVYGESKARVKISQEFDRLSDIIDQISQVLSAAP